MPRAVFHLSVHQEFNTAAVRSILSRQASGLQRSEGLSRRVGIAVDRWNVRPPAIGSLCGQKFASRFLNRIFVFARPRQSQQTPTLIINSYRLSFSEPR